MMYAAVKFVSDELNSYLTRKLPSESDPVLFGRMQEPDGSISPNLTDKIVISLVNIERATVQGRAPVSVSSSGDRANIHSSPLFLNLFLLVSANFSNYSEALRYLSATAAFFQSRKEMTRDSVSILPDGIEKLDLQLENLSTHELSNLWGMMGGRHYPCLYYKLRMVTVDIHDLIQEVPGISQPGVDVGS